MDNTKNSQELDSLMDGPWDELYVLTDHWRSDLEFYRDDLLFLHHLIDRYFMWITKSENLGLVKEIKKEMFDMNTKNKDLLEKVKKHKVQLGRLVENPNHKDAGIIKTEHEHLEEEMASFVKSFRKNRKEVFKITEYIIDSEHLEQIMQS
jgi:hypothetical protein